MITKALYLLENSLPCYLRKVVVLMFKVVLHDIVKTVNLTTQLAAWTALRDTIQCKKGLWETWNAWNSVQMVSPRTWTLMGRWFAKIHSQVRVIKLLVSCRLVVCPWGLVQMVSPRTWTLMGRWFAKIHSQVRVIKLLVSCRLVVCPWGLAKRGCTSYAQKLSKKVLLF